MNYPLRFTACLYFLEYPTWGVVGPYRFNKLCGGLINAYFKSRKLKP